MITEIGIAVLTAVLSSVLTLTLARWEIKRRQERVLATLFDRAGTEVERRVRAGAKQAGEDLLPLLGEKVREGFEQAIVALATGKPADLALQELGKTAVRTIGEGIDALFGRKRS